MSMIVVDNQFIKNRILASVAMMEAVPQLRSLKAELAALERECSTCAGKVSGAKKLAEKWNEVRQLLVTLPEDKRKIIRQHLGLNQTYRVTYRTGVGPNTKYPGGFI